MSTARSITDGRSSARAKQAAADRTLTRVVRVRAPCQDQKEARGNHPRGNGPLHDVSFPRDFAQERVDAGIVPTRMYDTR